ncbi:Putative heme-binding peroxidase [Durusdinium trenchii]|uniref:Heme-binding peroxidase n=1 Tax=Durusdinium trenchii TaxID=1381693 RepID=A0ABP0SH96_9DINO
MGNASSGAGVDGGPAQNLKKAASAAGKSGSSAALKLAKRVSQRMAPSSSSSSSTPVDYDAVRADLKAMMDSDSYDDGSHAPILIRLGWHSSGTFDKESGTGGSNAAGMRFSPEKDDPENAGLEVARGLLEPIKKKHPGIPFADLWILAAYVALEHTDGPVIEFTPGRQDVKGKSTVKPGRLPGAETGLGEGVDDQGRINGWENLAAHIREVFGRMGFSDREIVALLCGGHVYGRCHPNFSGYAGAWVEEPTKFSNEYAADLLDDEWMYVDHDTTVEGQPIPEETRPAPGKRQYMTAWSPSQEKEDLEEIEAAQATNFPPGQYKVTDDWINVRRTHSPESDKIDQPKEGTVFNVVNVREFGKGVRGQLDVGGWASIVSSSGEALMERVGDLDLKPASFRLNSGAEAEALLFEEAPTSVAAADAAEAQGNLADSVVKISDFAAVEDSGSSRLYGLVADGSAAGKWVLMVSDSLGSLLERIEPGYNDTPRKALQNGGILEVKYQMMLPSDMVLLWDEDFRKVLEEYAEDEELLKSEFGDAFKRLTELGVPACPMMS